MPDYLRKGFLLIGCSNFHIISWWWKDVEVFHEESSVEDIVISFFHERFGASSDFMDIVNDDHFSQVKSVLLDVRTDFYVIFDDYTPWEWLSWYIHGLFDSQEPLVPCSFCSGEVKSLKHVQHFHYEGTITKKMLIH